MRGPPDPQVLTELAILPLGTTSGVAPRPQSILLFGPAGSGKSLLISAVATECGAAVLNISPSILEGKYKGKQVGGGWKMC